MASVQHARLFYLDTSPSCVLCVWSSTASRHSLSPLPAFLLLLPTQSTHHPSIHHLYRSSSRTFRYSLHATLALRPNTQPRPFRRSSFEMQTAPECIPIEPDYIDFVHILLPIVDAGMSLLHVGWFLFSRSRGKDNSRISLVGFDIDVYHQLISNKRPCTQN